jgi:hypothetical protein
MKPYSLLLGGKHPDALIELHDICFTMADNQEMAFKAVVNRWFGDLKSAHIDAWLDLSIIDKHKFNANSNPSGKSLYFINIGSYKAGVFKEDHQYLFLICKDEKEAKSRALSMTKMEALLPHVDNLSAIDLLIEIKEIDNFNLGWEPTLEETANKVEIGYWPLSKYR